ncbi:MAG: hypothetical protein IT204_16595 [Fimbriimonadaceae bacterium]|nr:hypothetical protein [Fimbriimonadaceae bacterium]
MQVLDYGRSFVSFVLPDNTARLQLEARLLLTLPGAATQEIVMFASCKSEDCYVASGLFRDGQDNYDFSGLFGPSRYRLHRVWADADRAALDLGDTLPRFDNLLRHPVYVEATPLPTKAAVIAATLAGRPLVARTTASDAATGVTAVLEYPIKTMNVQRDRGVFQIDTGPVPLYDFASAHPDPLGRIAWAYVALNEFRGAFFIAQAPTPLPTSADPRARTMHYSQHCAWPAAVNQVLAVG